MKTEKDEWIENIENKEKLSTELMDDL